MKYTDIYEQHVNLHKYNAVSFPTFKGRLIKHWWDIDRAIKESKFWYWWPRYTVNTKEDIEYYHNYKWEKKTLQAYMYWLKMWVKKEKALDKIKL